MTGNEIVSAMALQLKKSFTDVPRRYKESQNQNIIRPCFFIKELANPMDKQMFDRYKRNPRYRITFLPETTSDSIEETCRGIGERLLECFCILKFSDGQKVRGRNMEYEIVNNELLFTVEYPMDVILRPAACPAMKSLAQSKRVKH